MTLEDANRVWSQEELALHLKTLGWSEVDIAQSGRIPQGAKYISPEPPTEADIARAHQLIEQHPEWKQYSSTE
jgi:hypothetical protein